MKEKNYIRSYGFSKGNLWILLVSLGLLLVGYILLSGGGSKDGVSFDPAVFATRRVVWAPVLLAWGYFGVVLSLLFRRKPKRMAEDAED